MECRYCGYIRQWYPDGSEVSNPDKGIRCDELQRRDGYTLEHQAKEAVRIVVNLRYAHLCDAHLPREEGVGYHPSHNLRPGRAWRYRGQSD